MQKGKNGEAGQWKINKYFQKHKITAKYSAKFISFFYFSITWLVLHAVHKNASLIQWQPALWRGGNWALPKANPQESASWWQTAYFEGARRKTSSWENVIFHKQPGPTLTRNLTLKLKVIITLTFLFQTLQSENIAWQSKFWISDCTIYFTFINLTHERLSSQWAAVAG